MIFFFKEREEDPKTHTHTHTPREEREEKKGCLKIQKNKKQKTTPHLNTIIIITSNRP